MYSRIYMTFFVCVLWTSIPKVAVDSTIKYFNPASQHKWCLPWRSYSRQLILKDRQVIQAC
jgi:hypothetical protein